MSEPSPGIRALEHVPLLETMLRRRSRRFALGSTLDSEPLKYASRHSAVPLSLEEEAVISFAGTGITGFSLGELPYAQGDNPLSGGGNIMVNQLARTIPSADGVNSTTLFLLNDDGAFQIRRPQHYPKDAVPELVEKARRRAFTELYEGARIRIADRRPEVPREPPYTPAFNIWSANIPGSTYCVLISETTTLALTVLFLALSEEMGFFVYDERNGFKPAGLKPFARSKGGHLRDDPNELRFGTVGNFESYIMELMGVEQGLMIQNIQLAAEALGLGSFPHYGAQPWSWFEALGFRMEQWPLSKLMAAGPAKAKLMSMVKKNPTMPVPVGIEVDGEPTIKPYSPPYYESMEAAVHAFVDAKFAEGKGIFRDGSDVSAWADPATVQRIVPSYTQKNIDAVVAYCEYVYGRYGRFLGNFGPFRNLMALQVHHVDTEFYDRFYRPGTYHDAHRDHFATWHGESRPSS
jgi:hypothetical protein